MKRIPCRRTRTNNKFEDKYGDLFEMVENERAILASMQQQ